MTCDDVISHVFHCEKCFKSIRDYVLTDATRKAGSVISEAKAEAARLNGMKGGRPRKVKVEK